MPKDGLSNKPKHDTPFDRTPGLVKKLSSAENNQKRKAFLILMKSVGHRLDATGIRRVDGVAVFAREG